MNLDISTIINHISFALNSQIFWHQTIRFLALWIATISLSGLPYLITHSKSQRKLSWLLFPIIGFFNLLFLIQIYVSLNFFLPSTQPASLLIIPILLITEIVILIASLTTSRVPLSQISFGLNHAKHLRPALLVSSIALLSFLAFSIRYFEPSVNNFNVPGYEVNHDAINILSGVKVLNQNYQYQPSFGWAVGNRHLHNYPLGNDYLIALNSQILGIEPYSILNQVILASFLIILFPIGYFLLSLKKNSSKTINYYIAAVLVTSVWNFLSIAMLNSSVVASVLVVPAIAISWFLVYWYNSNRISYTEWLVYTWITLTASVFLYSFVATLYYLAFLLVFALIFRPKNSVKHLLLPALIIIVLAYATPHNIITSLTQVKLRFLTDSRELNVFQGTLGNTASHLNPFQALSFWFSNPYYIQAASRVRNSWLIFGLLVVFIPLMNFFQTAHQKLRHHWFKLAAVFGLTFLIFMATSIVVTKSSYHNAKVMHHFAIFWPTIFFLLAVPLSCIKQITARRYANLAILSTFAIMFLSGLYTFRFIGTPTPDRTYELIQHETEICQEDYQPLLVLSRDEWSSYALFTCEHPYFYFDRRVNSTNLVQAGRINNIGALALPCTPKSLKLPGTTPTTYDSVLVDNCFTFDHPDYVAEKYWDYHTLYQRKEISDQAGPINE